MATEARNKVEEPREPTKRFVFNRLELAGSLGDLGTLLPIADPTVVGDFSAGDCQAPNRPRANTL